MDFENLLGLTGSYLETMDIMIKASIWETEKLVFSDWLGLVKDFMKPTMKSDSKAILGVSSLVLNHLCGTAVSLKQIVTVLEENFPIGDYQRCELYKRLEQTCAGKLVNWYQVWNLSRPDTDLNHDSVDQMIALSNNLTFNETQVQVGDRFMVAVMVFLETGRNQEIPSCLSFSDWLSVACSSVFGGKAYRYAIKHLDVTYNNEFDYWQFGVREIQSQMKRRANLYPLYSLCRTRMIQIGTFEYFLECFQQAGETKLSVNGLSRSDLIMVLLSKNPTNEQLRAMLEKCEIYERSLVIRALKIKACEFEDWLALYKYGADCSTPDEQEDWLRGLKVTTDSIEQIRSMYPLLRGNTLWLDGMLIKALTLIQSYQDRLDVSRIFRFDSLLSELIAASNLDQLGQLYRNPQKVSHNSELVKGLVRDRFVELLKIRPTELDGGGVEADSKADNVAENRGKDFDSLSSKKAITLFIGEVDGMNQDLQTTLKTAAEKAMI
ncbi:hypothetical protein A2480_03370 [Candidatus Uhrbacteria bacterium RIFOXYC2_FULL_47_19]|uniref:Uncharacterized protein n=1 Tax=Candidatus Uhrbacteria bacterium RIFOXYC2_FULL_47_19 TaxID=1802424 RepID=A0A1F7WF52_9BACT|nr:MAG: hypothetical protein A2480_03370 [Candidatus Uhrbacteria bacterium RIFOXYC2_FULL_47_19]